MVFLLLLLQKKNWFPFPRNQPSHTRCDWWCNSSKYVNNLRVWGHQAASEVISKGQWPQLHMLPCLQINQTTETKYDPEGFKRSKSLDPDPDPALKYRIFWTKDPFKKPELLPELLLPRTKDPDPNWDKLIAVLLLTPPIVVPKETTLYT